MSTTEMALMSATHIQIYKMNTSYVLTAPFVPVAKSLWSYQCTPMEGGNRHKFWFHIF